MLPDRSGVYMIINTVTEAVYVGSAVNLRIRCNSHFSKLDRGIHHSIKLQRSYNKHGKSAFTFYILEYASVNALVAREQFWLDRTKAFGKGYNMQPVAVSSIGIKRSEEFRLKCRQRMLGTKQSLEQRLRRSMRGVQIRDEDRHRRRVDKMQNGEILSTYNSIKEAAAEHGILPTSITKVCKNNGKNKTAGGFQWKYAA